MKVKAKYTHEGFKFLEGHQVNSKLTVRLYEETATNHVFVGIEHFYFSEEILLSFDSADKLAKIISTF